MLSDHSLGEAHKLFCLPKYIDRSSEEKPRQDLTTNKKFKKSNRQQSLNCLDDLTKKSCKSLTTCSNYGPTPKKKKTSQKIRNRIQKNYLYEHGQDKIEQQNRRRSRINFIKDQVELSECSFKPKIQKRANSHSTLDYPNSHKENNDKSWEQYRSRLGTFDLLYLDGQDRNKKSEYRKYLKDNKEIEGLTLKPRTNMVSNILDRKRMFELIKKKGRDLIGTTDTNQDFNTQAYISFNKDSHTENLVNDYKQGTNMSRMSRSSVGKKNNGDETSVRNSTLMNKETSVRNSTLMNDDKDSNGCGYDNGNSNNKQFQNIMNGSLNKSRQLSKGSLSKASLMTSKSLDDLKACQKKTCERTELLYEDGKARNKRLRYFQNMPENSDCTFAPILTRKSNKLIADKIVKEKQRKIDGFTDKINGKSYFLNNKNMMDIDLNGNEFKHFLEGNVYQRSLYYDQIKKKKIDLANEAKETMNNYDTNTGQVLFQPNQSTNKYYRSLIPDSDRANNTITTNNQQQSSSKFSKNSHKESHFKSSSSRHKSSNKRNKDFDGIGPDVGCIRFSGNKQMVRDAIQKSKEKYDRVSRKINYDKKKLERSASKGRYDSMGIINEKLNKVKKKLFELLDADCDGQISANRINIEQIPTYILKIISPILFELEAKNQVLTKNEFNLAIDRLLKRLNIDERNVFTFGKISPGNGHGEDCYHQENLTFQVSIFFKNKKSQKFVKNLRNWLF